MRPTILHIGYHKSASTTLQQALFARHSEVANLGEPDEDPDAWSAIRNVINANRLNSKKREALDMSRNRELWASIVAKLPEAHVPVFSKETLTLHEFFPDPRDASLPSLLHRVIEPAKVVIMVRNQIELIESLYLYHTRGYHYSSFDTWIEERMNGPLKVYRFSEVAQNYASVFGRENVGIFSFHELRETPQVFAGKLSEFMGINAEESASLLANQRKNKRVSNRYRLYSKLRKQTGLYIPIGKYLPGSVRASFNRFLMSGKESRPEFPPEWRREIGHLYREDNDRLSSEWGVTIEKNGINRG